MADQTPVIDLKNRYNVNANEVVAKCPIPLVYDNGQFPRLTVNQLVVLNYLEYEITTDKPMSRKEFCACLGWHPSTFYSTEHQQRVVDAWKSLYIGKGISIGRAIPKVLQARIAQAQSRGRGSNQAARLVLETAGVLGANAKSGPTVNINAEQVNVSFSKSMSVILAANQQSEEISDDV